MMKGQSDSNNMTLALNSKNDVRKVSCGSSALNTAPNGFEINLLANSLTSKLKHHRRPSTYGTKDDSSHNKSKPPTCPSHMDATTRAMKSILSRQAKRDRDSPERRGISSKAVRRGESLGRHESSGHNRADSPSSDKFPILSPHIKTSNVTSRRSSSAGNTRASSGRATVDRSRSELAFNYSRSETCGSAVSFESRRADSTIKVTKRDGVFKPVDKYAPGRHVLRESGSRRAACDYETYVLPFCEDNVVGSGSTSPRGNQNLNKKQMKVSWKVFHEDLDDPDLTYEDPESHLEQNMTPSTPNIFQRANPVDNFAFRRPVHTSGRSKVTSIGVNWTIPSVAQEEVVKPESSKKPMWSWLVTHETPQANGQHKTHGGHPASYYMSTSGVSSNNGNSGQVMDVRTQHSRDVHPVSTAMDREGTSVSKTKWTVPSSRSSTLDAERAMMGRLELVKQRGNHLLYEHGKRGTSNSAAKRFREALLAEKENEEEPKENYKIYVQNVKTDDTDATAQSETRRDELSSSPAKSRSTYY